MDVGAKVVMQDFSKAVVLASEEGSDKALRSSGAYIAKVARSSIKRRKEVRDPRTGRISRPGSPAGSPPFTYTGHIKKVIRFGKEKKEKRVLIGAVNQYAATIWDRHEKGGTFRDRPRKHLVRRTFAMGDFGPIKADGYGRRVRWITLRTAGQVRRANDMIALVNSQRDAEAQKSRTYPARPFMGPALAKSEAKVATFWSGAIK